MWSKVGGDDFNAIPAGNTKDFLIDFISLTMRFKSIAFAPENEYRYVFVLGTWGNDDLKTTCYPKYVNYREKNGYITPYIKMSFDKSCIDSITLGPTNKCELKLNSVLEFVRSKDVNISKINKSDIPIRF
jgi:hypothetical protein